MKKIANISILAVLVTNMAAGQESEHYFFRDSEILKPFISEIRSTTIKSELAWLNKLDDNYYVSDYSSRPFIEVHLGTEVPFYYLRNRHKNLKFSASGSIGNILLIDMFEEITSPIINTDYFFGLKTAVVKYINTEYIKNFGINLVPVFHESTHVGDEFSLHGYNNLPHFRRINVSYEAWELAAVLNDPDTITTNLFSAKVGIQGLWNNSKGYYASDSLETKNVMAPPSTKNYEYYIQLNLQRTSGFLCSERWMNIISAEARNRLRFSYDINVPEKRNWNLNIYFGWKRMTNKTGRNIGFFFRYYTGIIPNGQFRNTDGYRYAAISIVYD
ncbi:MAG: DUF1207 domain-containing protein [Ignavibacteria bacterium]|nr:DUF1207 domain-containing protein [Ignavibacteria bacterium]